MQMTRRDAWLEWSQSPAGNRVIVVGQWEARFGEKLAEHPFTEIVLFNGNNWGDFSYLLPYRESLRSIEVAAADDYSGLAAFTGVEKLVLRAAPRKLGTFDLTRYTRLRELGIGWHPKYPVDVISRLPILERCRIYGAKVETISELGASRALRSLTLDRSSKLKSLAGIEGFPSLEALHAGPCSQRLLLTGLDQCSQLKTLKLVGPMGVSKINVLSSINRLEELVIEGPADAPYSTGLFADKPALRQVGIYGDLSGRSVAPLLAATTLRSFLIRPVSETAVALMERTDARQACAKREFDIEATPGKHGILAMTLPKTSVRGRE